MSPTRLGRSVSNGALSPTAFNNLAHTASLHMGALSPGIMSGMQVQPLLPLRNSVPSLSMMVALPLIAVGAPRDDDGNQCDQR